jgi:tetraacyldisaccharide 4'-kinase
VPLERRDEIRARLVGACAGRLPDVWAEASHAPVALRDATGEREKLGWLAGRAVVGFAGIGNPAAFRDTLHALGADVVAFRAFADHHAYGAADTRALADLAAAHGAAALVTTLKDMVKITAHGASPRLLALEIAIVIERGADELGHLVDAAAEGRR